MTNEQMLYIYIMYVCTQIYTCVCVCLVNPFYIIYVYIYTHMQEDIPSYRNKHITHIYIYTYVYIHMLFTSIPTCI